MITESEILAGMTRGGRRTYLRIVAHKQRMADAASKRKTQAAKR